MKKRGIDRFFSNNLVFYCCVVFFAIMSVFPAAAQEDPEWREAIVGFWTVTPVFEIEADDDDLDIGIDSTVYDADISVRFFKDYSGQFESGGESIIIQWEVIDEETIGISYDGYSSTSLIHQLSDDSILMFENKGSEAFMAYLERKY